jgi:hypothetical protein
MSHVVTIETEVRDRAAVAAACRRLHLAPPEEGTARLFSAEQTGLLVRLPGWRYPLVCQTDTGRVAFDNYKGAWGATAELHHFLQAYAVEKTHLEARKQGYDVVEQPQADGSIRLTIQTGGAQ